MFKKLLGILLLIGLVSCDANEISHSLDSTPSTQDSSSSSADESLSNSNSSSSFDSSSSSDSSATEVITSIVINNKIDELVQGSTHTLNVAVTPSSLASQVVYKSSLPSCASISNDGQITALLPGSTIITVSAPDYSISDSFTLKVTKKIIHVENVTINNSETEMVETTTLKLDVTVSPQDATNKELTYTSSDNSYATVSNDGLITALKPTLEGQPVVIKAISKDNTQIEDSLSLTIKRKAISVQSITATLLSNDIMPNDKINFEVTLLPENADNKEYTVTTTTPEILEVGNNNVVTALKEGLGKLTFTSNDVPTVTTSLDVPVLKSTNYDYIKEKLAEASTIEHESASSGHFEKNEKSFYDDEPEVITNNWTVYTDGVMIDRNDNLGHTKKLSVKNGNMLCVLEDSTSDYSSYNGVTYEEDEFDDWFNKEENAFLPEIESSSNSVGLCNYIADYLDNYSSFSKDEIVENARVIVKPGSNQETITLTSSAEYNDSYWDESVSYMEVSMKLIFNENNALVSFESSYLKIDSDNYDAENHTSIDESQNDTTVISATINYDTRVATDDNRIKKEDYYVTSFEIDTSNFIDGNKINLKEDVNIAVINEVPERHLEEKYTVSSNNESIIECYNSNRTSICGQSEGQATITVTSEGGVSASIELTVIVPEVSSISLSYLPSSMRVGEKQEEIYAVVNPSGADQSYEIVLTEDSKDFATLEKVNDKYDLTAIAPGKVTIIARSLSKPEITDEETITIKPELNVESAKETLINNTYSAGYSGNETLVFNGDGTGVLKVDGGGEFTFKWELVLTETWLGQSFQLNITDIVEISSSEDDYLYKGTTSTWTVSEDADQISVKIYDDFWEEDTTLTYELVSE